MGEHRVSMRGSLRRYEDPARSTDPRVQAVVAGLATLDVPPPRAHFRAELRSQLVAVAPRLVAEGLASDAAPVARGIITDKPRTLPHPAAAPSRRSRFAGSRAFRFGRPLAIVTAAVAVVAFLLGGAVWISRHALPGDALYGLKRASENLELATASGPVDKAHDLLDFARTRSTEVSELIGGNGTVSGSTAGLVRSTLGSADSDVRQAARLLGAAAVQRSSTAPLAILTRWAPAQAAALRAIAAKISDPALRLRADQSLALLQAAVTRENRLAQVLGCMSGADSDALGPIPVARCTTPPTTVKPSRSGHPSAPPSTPGGSVIRVPVTSVGTTTIPAASTPGGSGPGSSTTSSGTQTLPISVPVSVPSSPVTAGSCGAEVSLPPIDISLGPCGIRAKIGG